ncbi:ABC transporter permease [uncultured Williamsia sp.]|uniref:ABC transporter permease n=1 Tax=uncultured Williamsia sp. TaxID=259311 RepID=UPI002633C1C3|nr:ABC transporter permease [uncultured Williamsia sp.]
MIVRIAWSVVAIAAVAIVIGASTDSVGSTDLGCSKTGSTGTDEYSCSAPIVDVVGVWPFVAMGAAMAGPPLLALVALRAWVSWVVVLVLIAVGAWGLAHWTSVWLTLVFAILLALVGLVLAAVQSALSLRASR